MKKQLITDKAFLNKKLELVTPEELPAIIKDLEDSFVGLKGYGLAANQIGILKQVAIIRFKDWNIDIINPTIILKDEKCLFPREGCLSFPGLRVDTDRYNKLIFESGFDRQNYFYYGMEAAICSHEIDHLMGRTIFEAKHKTRR